MNDLTPTIRVEVLADGRTVPSGEVIQTQVCVVGAGPAGLTIAKELDAAGVDVVLLERGPDPRVEPPHPATTAVNVGLPYRIDRSRMFGFGGATHRWHIQTPLGDGYGRLRELDDEDFAIRSWIPHSGWPINKDQLRRHYAQARVLFGLPPQLDDATTTPPANSVFDLDAAIVVRPFYFASPGMFGGDLLRGLELSPISLLLSNSAVTKIEWDAESGAVSAVEVSTSPSHRYVVTAQIFVLAAGGIENPRLLLSSQTSESRGLAKDDDLVGRYFMEHPHFPSGYLVPRSADDFADPRSYAVVRLGDAVTQNKYGLSDAVIEANGLARSVFYLSAEPMSVKLHSARYSHRAVQTLEVSRALQETVAAKGWRAGMSRDLWEVIRGLPHLGRHSLHRLSVQYRILRADQRYTQPHVFWMRAMAEQIPNTESRVRLGESTDPLGVPVAELDWRLTDQDLTSMRETQRLFGEAQSRIGHPRVVSFLDTESHPAYLVGGNHHMGTTRMAASSRKGVVDAEGRVHGHDNLFVAGSSIFPTVGYANPTLTIVALAFRQAERIIASLKRPVEFS